MSKPRSSKRSPARPPRAVAEIGADRLTAPSPLPIPVRALGAAAAGFILLPVHAIAYAFFGPALAQRQPNAMVVESRVYLRAVAPSVASTSVAGKTSSMFVTHHRSLVALRRTLDPAQFVSVSRSVVVNLGRLVEIDPTLGKRNVVLVDVGEGFREPFLVSRRCFARLRQTLGIPRRRPARRIRKPTCR